MRSRSPRLVVALVASALALLAACEPVPRSQIGPIPRGRADLAAGTAVPAAPVPTDVRRPSSAPTATMPPSTTTTSTTAAGSAADQVVSVRDHGAVGNGTSDDTAAFRAALAAAATHTTALYVPAGTYKLTATLAVPAAVQDLVLAPGAVLQQHADASILQKVGSVGAQQYAVSGATRGGTTITVDTASGLAVGDWLLFGSDDMSDVSKGFRHGFLRQIRSVSGTTIGLDRPLHRTLATNPRGWEVTLAPPLRIQGGVLEHASPLSVFQPTVHLELVRSPEIAGTEIRRCGASAIKAMHVAGGTFEAFTHDCVDDEGGARYGSGRHYGYGIEVGGTTRDLVVRGRATRVRHAFTTNGAYGPRSDKRILLIGEPEDVVVSMEVWETTSSGLDTHEVGWNITFRDCTVRDAGVYKREGSTNGKEGGFGIFVRARRTTVERCTVTRAAEDGLVVAAPSTGLAAWAPADGPVVRDTTIVDTEGKRGVHLKQPGTLERFTVDGHHLVGVHLDATAAGSTVRDGTIDLQGYPGGIGVIGSAYATVSSLVFGVVYKLFG